VAAWSWWIVLAPFGLAVVWWQFSDATGLTQRKAIDKMERRKVDRRDRALASLGLNRRRERQTGRARDEAAARAAGGDPTHADPARGPDPTQRGDAPR
jgi:small Trp-rich protein